MLTLPTCDTGGSRTAGMDCYACAQTLTDAYRTGDLDPVEVLDHRLERIDRLDPLLNAFALVLSEEARREAEASRSRWREGTPRGPLDGVPVAVKDLADVAGLSTGCGSRALANPAAERSATVVERLRHAGAVLVGKTQMVEFACGGWGTNAVLGTPWNPWDGATHRAPGGSSSGSAVAVAAGLVTAAIGSDTGGSVRIPCAFCGLTGLKTTFGRISVAGTAPLAKSFDTLGPMARTVRDAAIVANAIAGPDRRDPNTWSAPAASSLGEIGAGLAGVRVGIMPASEREGLSQGVELAYDAAIETMRANGAAIVSIALPEAFDDVRPRCGTMVMAEGFAALSSWVERDDLPLDPNVRARILTGRDVTLAQYLRLREDRDRTKLAWSGAIAEVDVLLTPTTPIAAPKLCDVDEASFQAARFTRAGNYLDWCAAVLPMGFSDGLPVSLQFYARPFREALALRVAAAFQRATTHHLPHPPVPADER